MYPLSKTRVVKILIVLLAAVAVLALSGCAAGMFPQVTYQGRLTDENGTPLNGPVKLRFSLYHQASSGTAIHSETDSVTVNDGMFNTVVGPGSAVAGLTPKDLAEPLWVEVQVSNGTYTETLTPRQRLYGAPYAFTLMPGTVISESMSTSLHGAGGIEGIVNIYNTYDGDAGDPALPALQLIGETSLKLDSPTSDDGSIFGSTDSSLGDLVLYSNDEIDLHLDEDNVGSGVFRIFNGANSVKFSVNENGDYVAAGSKSTAVDVDNQMRKLYTIESPEVWFEDFGSSTLKGGSAVVTLDSLFVKTVNLGVDYHVFLTPLGECNGLYVAQKTATSFEVRELGGGSASVAFDYRIVAKRVGYESARLDVIEPDYDGEK